MKKYFNIRVYGLLINHQQEVLVSKENIKGQNVIKFPGGGLEYGEGTVEGLKREWKEELEVTIDIISHFYTTDFFQPSAWDDSQVISIYYRVALPERVPFPYSNGKEYFYFIPVAEALPQLSLPIDKIVAGRLRDHFTSVK